LFKKEIESECCEPEPVTPDPGPVPQRPGFATAYAVPANGLNPVFRRAAGFLAVQPTRFLE
jgi:hypothetical protein